MSSQPNQSLGHGLSVLQAIAGSEGPVGSRELSRRLGMDHTRVNRLLNTLADLGLAMRTPDRAYLPGPGIHVLAAQALRSSRLVQAAWPLIQSELGDLRLVALGVLWRDQVCYLLFGRPDQPLEQALAAKELYPAGLSSIGSMLQACSGRGAAAAAIRRRGWAINPVPEAERSLAVPVGKPAVAALAGFPIADPDVLARRLAAVAERLMAALPRNG